MPRKQRGKGGNILYAMFILTLFVRTNQTEPLKAKNPWVYKLRGYRINYLFSWVDQYESPVTKHYAPKTNDTGTKKPSKVGHIEGFFLW